MSTEQLQPIEIQENSVTVRELEVVDPTIAEYLADVDPEEREEAFEHALRVGVKTMQLAQTSREEEFVERKFGEMHSELVEEIDRIESEVEATFGEDGDVPETIEEHFGDDGKLQRHIEDAFGEDGAFAERLDEELGEDGERIQEALDPDSDGTPTNRLKTTVIEEIRSLRDKIEEQATEEETREEIAQRTSIKGDDFEETVENLLEDAVYNTNDEVEATTETEGESSGRKVGDFVLTMGDTGQRIVVEAKSEQNYTQPKIKSELEDALENRDADYAVMVFACEEYVPDKVGYFQEFDDDRLAVALSTDEDDEIDPGYLHIGLNWARTRAIQSYVDTGNGIDPEQVQTDVSEIEESVQTFQTIRTKTTTIRETANEIDEKLREIQNEVETRVDAVRTELQDGSDS